MGRADKTTSRGNVQSVSGAASPRSCERKIMNKAKAWVSRAYEIIVYWSDEDECYIVRIPDLPGATREEAARNAEQAIELYLDCLREDGRPIPEPKGRLA
jgi:predicted RNase H-like HicB family nuclease